jgi:hypothetical protein
MSSSLFITDINHIQGTEDLTLRNLLITQTYSELSNAFASRMGPICNWCSFATWASKQAGQTIRKEDLQQSLHAIISRQPEIETALTLAWQLARQLGTEKRLDEFRQSALVSMLSAAATKASDAVSRGNKKVFDEIAREFVRFIDECFGDTEYNAATIGKFVVVLRPGPAPDGQDGLREAFTCYYRALFETDPQRKAELNLLANLLIGFHEQTRLQPEISEALNAAQLDVSTIKTFLREQLLGSSGFQSKFFLFIKRVAGKTSLLDKAIEALIQRVQYHLRHALTLHMMTLTIPVNRRLRLGRDLDLSYPDSMKLLTNPQLLALIKTTDPVANTIISSGAEDWASLTDRMHFIGELFRCCHLSPEMFNPPFSAEQVIELQNGSIPSGDL